ncbi:hypothetical protein D6779_06300, partial [Candidatus Parcubacteria bacterium]
MSERTAPFRRHLSDSFREALRNTQWVSQYLNDKELFPAIRDGYVSVYYKGNSLLKLKNAPNDEIAGKVHYKYLLDPDVDDQYISVDDIQFKLPVIDPRSDGAVCKLKKASRPYVGVEKEGVHDIIMNNADRVIDIEIAFSSRGKQNRIDLCALMEEDGKVRLRFYECKHFSNSEIRAEREPKVVGQIKRYGKEIASRCDEIRDAYYKAFDVLTREPFFHPARELMQRVCASRNLEVDPEVYLIIFGFDAAQRDDFKPKHGAKLE